MVLCNIYSPCKNSTDVNRARLSITVLIYGTLAYDSHAQLVRQSYRCYTNNTLEKREAKNNTRIKFSNQFHKIESQYFAIGSKQASQERDCL